MKKSKGGLRATWEERTTKFTSCLDKKCVEKRWILEFLTWVILLKNCITPFYSTETN